MLFARASMAARARVDSNYCLTIRARVHMAALFLHAAHVCCVCCLGILFLWSFKK